MKTKVGMLIGLILVRVGGAQLLVIKHPGILPGIQHFSVDDIRKRLEE
ncbi:MAG: hypothetical protein WC405_06165 [Syntrophales bacterium]